MTPRVALVTGAARGIGLAICRRLILSGDVVGMLDLDGEQLDIARRELSRESGSPTPVAAAPNATKIVETALMAGSKLYSV